MRSCDANRWVPADDDDDDVEWSGNRREPCNLLLLLLPVLQILRERVNNIRNNLKREGLDGDEFIEEEDEDEVEGEEKGTEGVKRDLQDLADTSRTASHEGNAN